MFRIFGIAIVFLTGNLWTQQTALAKPVPAYDQVLTNYDYPYPVSYYEFRDQGKAMKMAYMDIKPFDGQAGGHGGVVVLFHGKNFTSAYWEATIEALTQDGYRVVAVDQVGFGKSSKPERYQFSFQTLAKNTRGLLLFLGIKSATVMGHSMGGMVAARFALMYPEAVEQMVLINPLGLEDYKWVVPYRAIDVWVERELEQTPEAIMEYQKNNYYHGEWKEEYARWAEPLIGWSQGPDKKRIAWVSALTNDMIYTQPVLYEFPKVKVPVLLIIGDQETTAIGKDLVSDEVKKTLGQYKKLGSRAAGMFPRGKLVLLKGVGHLPHIEDFFHFIDPVLKFLNKERAKK